MISTHEHSILKRPGGAGKVRYVTIPLAEESDESRVPIRSYWKGELASLYGISLQTLRVWMAPFSAELEILGYRQDQKRLTRRQVELVFARVGEP